MLAFRDLLLEQRTVVAGGHHGRLAVKLLAEPVAVPDGRVVEQDHDLVQPPRVPVGEQGAPIRAVDRLQDLVPVHAVRGELPAFEFGGIFQFMEDTARFLLPMQVAGRLAGKASFSALAGRAAECGNYLTIVSGPEPEPRVEAYEADEERNRNEHRPVSDREVRRRPDGGSAEEASEDPQVQT